MPHGDFGGFLTSKYKWGWGTNDKKDRIHPNYIGESLESNRT